MNCQKCQSKNIKDNKCLSCGAIVVSQTEKPFNELDLIDLANEGFNLTSNNTIDTICSSIGDISVNSIELACHVGNEVIEVFSNLLD